MKRYLWTATDLENNMEDKINVMDVHGEYVKVYEDTNAFSGETEEYWATELDVEEWNEQFEEEEEEDDFFSTPATHSVEVPVIFKRITSRPEVHELVLTKSQFDAYAASGNITDNDSGRQLTSFQNVVDLASGGVKPTLLYIQNKTGN